jgi:hypothetical protein
LKRFVPSIVTAAKNFRTKMRVSRVKPLGGGEAALDTLICSEPRLAVAIDGFLGSLRPHNVEEKLAWNWG